MIPHGYTLADVDQLARIATVAARTGGLDAYTCHGLAWSAITETLLTADEAPGRRELVQAGWQAIHVELAACMHARGYQSGNTPAGPGASPRFMQFWYEPADTSAIDRLVDHLAAVQIGDVFTLRQGEAVTALALHEDYALAAASLGLSYSRFVSLVGEARAGFRALWFAPDTAPPAPRDKRRGTHPPRTHCREGHPMAGDNLRIHRRRGGKRERTCRTCEAARAARRTQQAA